MLEDIVIGLMIFTRTWLQAYVTRPRLILMNKVAQSNKPTMSITPKYFIGISNIRDRPKWQMYRRHLKHKVNDKAKENNIRT